MTLFTEKFSEPKTSKRKKKTVHRGNMRPLSGVCFRVAARIIEIILITLPVKFGKQCGKENLGLQLFAQKLSYII